MMASATHYPDVSAEELAAARRYPMEITWSPDDEVFLASFPDVPGVMIHGSTPEEAAANGEEVIVAWYTALRDAGLPIPPPTISRRRVRVAPPGAYNGDRVRAIRRRLSVSQRVFADLLNVSLGAVRSWEQGWRVPDGASVRLLDIAERSPEVLRAAMTPVQPD
jgi:DNA-binding transcriptional regulator YiaG